MTTRWLALALALVSACSEGSDERFSPYQDTQQAIVTTPLVARRSTWWVNPPGSAEDFCWKTTCWSPSGWSQFAAPLGYGESYVNTIYTWSDPAHKPTAIYVRREFTVADPALVAALRLEAMFDDGYVAYLNGQEIARVRMPQGPVNRDTLALGHEATSGVYESIDAGGALSWLKAGTNILAFEIHQVSADSSDLVFDGALVAELRDAPPPPALSSPGGIARGALWSYYDRGGDLGGTTWTLPSSSDASWARGAGPLGYGESYLATTVGFGGDANHRHITTYFRKTFSVKDPDDIVALRADLMYDDGAVIYLNGQRITSVSMPAGTTTASTLALSHEASGYQSFDWTAFKDRVREGDNVVAVEVHQASPSSGDLVFDLALRIETRPHFAIERGADWSYWDRGDLGTAWRAAAYDQRDWPTGRGPLGYGESYLATTTGPRVTTYFRRSFRVGDPAAVRELRGELMYDDGAVIYLNGTEIQRVSMPSGTVGFATLASGHEADNQYQSFDWSSARGLLRSGDNVIAVEVHQSSSSSSDLAFDLALEAPSNPWFVKQGGPVLEPPPDAVYDFSRNSPDVIRVGDRWRMYFSEPSKYHNEIAWVESSDGVHWTDAGHGPAGVGPTVVDDGTLIHLWYRGDFYDPEEQLPEIHSGIYYATIDAAGNRTAYGEVVPGVTGTAAVLWDGNQYRMWYPDDSGLRHAISRDGRLWEHTVGPVLAGHVADPYVRLEGGVYTLWYGDGTREIVMARSSDGITWSVIGRSLTTGAPGAWDHDAIYAPTVARDGQRLLMWYSGRDGARELTPVIGLAIADDSGLPPPPPDGIPRGAVWSYWDQGGDGDQNPGWRTDPVPGWPSGAGPLGYGESYLATTVGFGGDPAHKFVTTYFRKHFNVSSPTGVSALRAELMYDDGAVVYLNGVKIAAIGMPAGSGATTFALGHEAQNRYDSFDWSSSLGLLTGGSNTIAVELHQSSADSSDLVFDLALSLH